MAASTDLVLRPPSAVVIPVVAWAVLALGSVDILVRGTPQERLDYLPWLAVIAYLLWLVLWAPRVVGRADDVLVRDVLVSRTLPYGAITDIRTAGPLRIDYTDAAGATRRVRPWNAPATPRLGSPTDAKASERGRRHRDEDLHRRVAPAKVVPPKPIDTLLERWRSYPGSGGAARVRWHLVELGALAALVALALVL